MQVPTVKVLVPVLNDSFLLESVRFVGDVPVTRSTDPLSVPVYTVALPPYLQAVSAVFFVGTKVTFTDATGSRLLPEFNVAPPVFELKTKLAPVAGETDHECASKLVPTSRSMLMWTIGGITPAASLVAPTDTCQM
jgi:hypothetical protein